MAGKVLHVMKFDEAKLWAKFIIIVFIPPNEIEEQESDTFSICNSSANFKLKLKFEYCISSQTSCLHFFVKIAANKSLLFKINIPTVLTNEYRVTTEIDSWSKFEYITKTHEYSSNVYNYELKITLVKQTQTLPYELFDKLYEDSELTDFELQGEDGSVSVHKNVLAASSPVLRTMLLGEWRETREGRVNLPSISKVSLEHFKEYLYKRKIPENALACSKLLPLAEMYMMPDMTIDCALKMSTDFVPELACEWLEYFIKNKDYELFLSILENTDTRKIKALREYFSKTKDSK